MENKKEDTNLILPITIIILIVIVVLYLLTLGKLNFLDSELKNKRRSLEERKKIIDSQFEKIEELLNKKKQLKLKLDKINQRVLIAARASIVFIIIAISLFVNITFKLTLLDIGSYLGLLFFIVACIAFISFGNPEKGLEFWKYFEKKLTLKIYGKYLNLEHHFEKHKKQKESLLLANEEVKLLLKEVEEQEQLEQKILNTLKEQS
ncbi:MAG: hypothetical protein MH472_03470 [Bacteroidia bacterium]|nr:hypothetical protein [Bacteroidia bacterium]